MNTHRIRRILVGLLVTTALFAAPAAWLQPASAQYVRPAGVRGLPQEHEYQKQLRAFWAKLTEADFALPFTDATASPLADADEQWRNWALSLDVPRVGGKRSSPSLTMPAREFLLTRVEGPTVIQPGAWPEPLTWIANWNRPGNPFFNLRAAKLRAFVVAAQDMMMVDEQHEHNGKFPMWRRADWFGPHLLMYAYTYDGVKDALPAEARTAYETGLKKMILRVCGWGPKGEETYLDMTAVTGMVIAEKTLKDPEISKAVEAYVRPFFTDGELYNAAGYFADQGCFDPGFNGLSMYFATWAALAGDWPWMKSAVAQSWKLRGYLMLPEPDAYLKLTRGQTYLGPTHMTLRTGSHSSDDQWPWPYKFVGGAYLSDDAMCQVAWPTDDQFKASAAASAEGVTAAMHQNPQDPAAKVSGIYIKNEDLRAGEWVWRMWPGHADFPMTNFGYDYYPKGFAAHRAELLKQNPELFKRPFDRAAAFTEQFGNALLIAKTAGNGPNTFGVIVHTGPVSEYPGKELLEYPNAPYGLGGGTLSAFWTPATGSVILGRRGGMYAPGGQPKVLDDPDEWRNWPVHAVIGSVDGKTFFISARNQHPECSYDVKDAAAGKATVKVGGVIPASPLGKDKALQGRLEYARVFALSPEGLRVETSIKGDGVDKVAELYEAIPVFHRDGVQIDETIKATIDLQAGGAWSEAAPAYTNGVTAIRITRFKGAVIVRFDRPRRVKLSPAEAKGGFLTGHVCRNVLIDLLENSDQPSAVTAARTISYTIAPAGK